MGKKNLNTQEMTKIKDRLEIKKDETVEIKVIKKNSKKLEQTEDFNDFDDLSSTREIRVINKKNNKYDLPNEVQRFEPKVGEGLNLIQVEDRHRKNLTNETPDKLTKSVTKIILSNIFTFFNMLLVGIGIALMIVGSFTEIFFLVIATLNTLIGIYQELKAKKAVDKLKVVNSPTSKVVRAGEIIEILTSRIVLDDIIYLSTGKQVPTDAILKEGVVEVNESMLTGESLPIKKVAGDLLFAGSFISSGTCYAQVERLGKETYAAKLQNKAKKVKNKNSILLNSLNKIIKIVSIILIPIGIAMTLVNIYGSEAVVVWDIAKEVVERTAGSMVAMIPSGLFLLVSSTLYVSVVRLSKKKAIVKELYSIESLARVDVLCLDKTGTITDGTMEVEDVVVFDKKANIEEDIGNVLGAFTDVNQTSLAMLKKYPAKNSYNIISTIPFSSSRKLSVVTFKYKGSYLLGAPEFVLPNDKDLLKLLEQYTRQGYRVLVLAKTNSKITDEKDINGDNKPLAAFIIKDHIRPEAKDTISWFKNNGVQVKIISGDNPITVSEIAKKVGVEDADKCVSLEGLSLDEVASIAGDYTVFGRVAPEQKATLIRALKALGKTVAMTGDGVNDILALKEADCSIAMGTGSEAATSVAQLVLSDSNFASMPQVVEEGRRVINNVQHSACLFLMKTVFAISLTIITLIVNFCGQAFVYPFSPSNMYVIEFACIGVPAFFLALQTNNNLIKGNFLKNVFLKAMPGGISLLLSVLLILALKNVPGFLIETEEVSLVMAGYSLSFCGLLILFTYCQPVNTYRIIVYIAMLLLAVILMFVFPVTFTGLDYNKLSITNWLLVIVSTFTAFTFYRIVDGIRERFN